MVFTKLIESKIHQNGIITAADIKYAKFCDILADQPQEIQDFVLVSNFLIEACTYKNRPKEDISPRENAIIVSVDEALTRLNINNLFEINHDSSRFNPTSN